MLNILQFIFSSGWIFFGFVLLMILFFGAVSAVISIKINLNINSK